MIVLDTNVLSEVLKPSPSAAVLSWLSAQESAEVFLTAITQAEVLYGLELLPAGKRRASLLAAADKLFLEDFDGRILPFEEASARSFAKIVAARSSAGRPIAQFDGMIAAICSARRGALATRNVSDFENCGVRIINPWDA
jgi:predicted nucleic acid-binding protein